MSRNLLLRLFGWRALLVQGDNLFVERVAWVRHRLWTGSQKTLDAGCGAGGLTMLASRSGNDAIGLTFADADAVLATERAPLVGAKTAGFEVIDLRDLGRHVSRLTPCDQVIACEVIEHLKDDAGLIRNLAAVLRPDGQLLLTTPFADHHPVYRERVHVSGVEDGRHVRYGYTHAELEAMFANAGLRVTERGYLNGYFAQKVFSLYLLLGRLHPKFGWLLTLPLRPLRFLDPIVARLTRYPFMSVTMVGVKVAEPRAVTEPTAVTNPVVAPPDKPANTAEPGSVF